MQKEFGIHMGSNKTLMGLGFINEYPPRLNSTKTKFLKRLETSETWRWLMRHAMDIRRA